MTKASQGTFWSWWQVREGHHWEGRHGLSLCVKACPCIHYLQDRSKLSFLFPNSIKEPLICPRFVVMSP